MKVINNYIYTKPVQGQVANQVIPGIFVRNVITTDDGAPNFRMRVIDFEPGSSCPKHSHWWEHEVFILSGQGVMVCGQREIQLVKDMIIYIAPNEEHYFINNGDETLRFICLVPLAADE